MCSAAPELAPAVVLESELLAAESAALAVAPVELGRKLGLVDCSMSFSASFSMKLINVALLLLLVNLIQNSTASLSVDLSFPFLLPKKSLIQLSLLCSGISISMLKRLTLKFLAGLPTPLFFSSIFKTVYHHHLNG